MPLRARLGVPRPVQPPAQGGPRHLPHAAPAGLLAGAGQRGGGPRVQHQPRPREHQGGAAGARLQRGHRAPRLVQHGLHLVRGRAQGEAPRQDHRRPQQVRQGAHVRAGHRLQVCSIVVI